MHPPRRRTLLVPALARLHRLFRRLRQHRGFRPLLRRSHALPILVLAPLMADPTAAGAQVAEVRVEENLRAAPNGAILGQLMPGTELAVGERRDRWLEVEMEGWVWIRSLQVTDRGGLDLVVSESEGENLRSEPRGTILARLEGGTLLEELERIPAWIRVRRRGWIWAPSVALSETMDAARAAPAGDQEAVEPAGPAPVAGSPEAGASPEEGASAEAGESSESEGDADATAGAASTDGPGRDGITMAPDAGLEVLVAPDGDTLATVAGRAEVEVLDRQEGWVRVRVEGWTWAPGEPETQAAADRGEDTASPASTGADAVAPIEPADVMADPDAHVGRIVRWPLQFVSLERAERIRTDFFRGEPFLLTRSPDSDGGFIYVAVPPDRMDQVVDLTPLERVIVRGRLRTGASAFTGSPIVDLLELRRVERQRP